MVRNENGLTNSFYPSIRPVLDAITAASPSGFCRCTFVAVPHSCHSLLVSQVCEKAVCTTPTFDPPPFAQQVWRLL